MSGIAFAMNRPDNSLSWVLRTSLAASGDDAMILIWVPSRSDMRGPWTLAKLASMEWSCLPIWKKFPTIGHANRPGGSGGFLDNMCLK